MNFDRVAPFYRRLETLVFGGRLQVARSAFVRQLPAARRALVIGEGDGRFLEELRKAQPELPVECLDGSAKMLALAQARVGDRDTHFLQADIRAAAFPPARYDLLVTHFFLDCFEENELREVVNKLAGAAAPDAIWLVADFHQPPHGWSRVWSRWLIGTMYCFFRAAAGLEARQLVDPAPFLTQNGFSLTSEVVSPSRVIRSQLWRRHVDMTK